MGRPATDPVIAFESQAAWETWLAEHHATSSGVWVKIAKKASGIPTATFAEALEGALCYGWIDGQRNRFDDQWFLQPFTPRRPQSNWSKINRATVEQLIEQSRMHPAGLRESSGPGPTATTTTAGGSRTAGQAATRLHPSTQGVPQGHVRLGLYVIGIGMDRAGQHATVQTNGEQINVAIDDQIIRRLTIDPTRTYQPPPGDGLDGSAKMEPDNRHPCLATGQ